MLLWVRLHSTHIHKHTNTHTGLHCLFKCTPHAKTHLNTTDPTSVWRIHHKYINSCWVSQKTHSSIFSSYNFWMLVLYTQGVNTTWRRLMLVFLISMALAWLEQDRTCSAAMLFWANDLNLIMWLMTLNDYNIHALIKFKRLHSKIVSVHFTKIKKIQ